MTAKKAAKPKVAKNAAPPEVVVAYKGFDANLVCNPTGEKPFQYAIGETYHHNGEVVRCAEGGFHACENPIEVFGYYAPAGSRYCLVEASGAVDRDSDDTKIACGSITIKAELKLPELIIRAIDWVTARMQVVRHHHRFVYLRLQQLLPDLGGEWRLILFQKKALPGNGLDDSLQFE